MRTQNPPAPQSLAAVGIVMRGVNERHAAPGAAGEVAPQLICVVSQDRMRLARLREPLPSLAELRHDLAERIVDPITGNPRDQKGCNSSARTATSAGLAPASARAAAATERRSGIEDTVCGLRNSHP